jgi:hypothetical protein
MAAPFSKGVTAMYLVLFLDQQDNYEFITSLHSSLPSAEAAFKALLLRFGVNPEDRCDRCGEEPHIYRIECDGKPAEEIFVSDLAAAFSATLTKVQTEPQESAS